MVVGLFQERSRPEGRPGRACAADSSTSCPPGVITSTTSRLSAGSRLRQDVASHGACWCPCRGPPGRLRPGAITRAGSCPRPAPCRRRTRRGLRPSGEGGARRHIERPRLAARTASARRSRQNLPRRSACARPESRTRQASRSPVVAGERLRSSPKHLEADIGPPRRARRHRMTRPSASGGSDGREGSHRISRFLCPRGSPSRLRERAAGLGYRGRSFVRKPGTPGLRRQQASQQARVRGRTRGAAGSAFPRHPRFASLRSAAGRTSPASGERRRRATRLTSAPPP